MGFDLPLLQDTKFLRGLLTGLHFASVMVKTGQTNWQLVAVHLASAIREAAGELERLPADEAQRAMNTSYINDGENDMFLMAQMPNIPFSPLEDVLREMGVAREPADRTEEPAR